jgi:hypothetical protein
VSTRSALLDGLCSCFDRLFRATNARRLTPEGAEIVEFGSANSACLQDFNRADHGGIYGEDSFHADPKTDTPDRERRAGKLAAPADHNTFKGLDALLFPFRFLQSDVYTHGITRAKCGDTLAGLVLADLLNYAIHMDSPGQTHYGGASAKEDA